MNRRHLLTVFAAMFVTGCSRSTWVEVSSPDGGFGVSMPGPPRRAEQSRDSGGGQLTWVSLTYKQRTTSYSVTFGDYPEAIMPSPPTEKVLSSAIHRMMFKWPSANKIKDEAGVFQGFPSRDFVVEDPGSGLRAIGRQVLVGRRQYLVQVTTPIGNSTNPDVNRFLDSFKIVNAKEARR